MVFRIVAVLLLCGLTSCSFVDLKVNPPIERPKTEPKVPERVPPSEPPFHGTAFIVPRLIGPGDPTSFTGLSAAGKGSVQVFDRRPGKFIHVNAYLFNITFDDGLVTQAQVNPEFSQADAQAIAQKYGRLVGQLPRVLRKGVKMLWIHKGNQDFGGGNDSLTIHTERGDEYERGGFLEDILIHEAAHTSLDRGVAQSALWLLAEKNDGQFISTYANQNRTREDVAESFLPYLALRYRPERATVETINNIVKTMPHRILFFDSQNYPMHPMAK